MKIVSKALVSDNNARILVLRRSLSHPHFPHHLDFPGGEVEDGESSSAAVEREIIEETGLILQRESVRLVHEKQVSQNTVHQIYEVKVAEVVSEVKLSWEHDAYFWMSINELVNTTLPENADDYLLTVLDYLHNNR